MQLRSQVIKPYFIDRGIVVYCRIERILERLSHQKLTKFYLGKQLTASLAVTISGGFVD